MSEISSVNVVGVSARYAAQIRELLVARAHQREIEKAFAGVELASKTPPPSHAADEGRVDELA